MRIMHLCPKSLAILLSFMLIHITTTAQTTYTFQSGKMTIAGTSTLHDWVSDVTEINFQGMVTVEDQTLASIKKVSLSIPVLKIKSTKGKAMDKKTYEALKSEKYPNIECNLAAFKIEKIENKYKITANGKLTIAGTSKDLILPFSAQLNEDGTLKFTGSKALKMTDFNIAPPKALLGTLKTGDDITIEFTVLMKPNQGTATTK